VTLTITRVDKTLPLPKYHTKGAAAFDLYARVDWAVKSQTTELIPANLIVQVPEGYMLMIAARSSTPIKKGLILRNGIGIVDQDYRGPKDELRLQVYNFTDQEVRVARGERLAQAVLVKIAKVEFEEAGEIDGSSRGGFGSTGYSS
jgi:dUTP pyrophosphatase